MKINEFKDGELATSERVRYLRALASPARLEVVEGLQLCGPSSVAELARRLGRAADSLYYHLRELEKVGVVEVCGTTPAPRGHGGRRGAIYRLAKDVVGVDDLGADDRERAALGDMASAVLRLTERNVALALAGPEPMRPPVGYQDLPTVQRTKAWLTPTDLAELTQLVGAVDDFLRARAEPATSLSGEPTDERTLCALTLALTTLPPRTA